MAVITHVVLENVTREEYDAVRAECGWLTRTPDGGICHLTWWEGTTCHNTDVWESPEAFAAFGERRLGPAMAKVGVAAEPKVTFHDAHEVFLPNALARTVTPV